MRFLEFLTLLVLFALLVIGVYLLWGNLPTATLEFESYKANISQDLPTESGQFYANMRYPSNIITYSLSETCNRKKISDFREAVNILEQKTVLEFRESTTPQITVTCSNIAPKPEEKDHFVAGEGGPTLIINTTQYYVITSGKIALYQDEKCDTPQVAVHELLHALGFDHNGNETSIMYPITSCDQTIDPYIINEIKRLYSQPSAPDLIIENVEANKSGRYLSFETTISNIGLEDVNEAKLDLIVDGEVIRTFDLNQIPLGAKKHLSITNLRLPRTFEDISLYTYTDQTEITTANNKANLHLESM